jgi:hypothetical protein
VAYHLLQIAILLLHQLVQPVHQLNIRVARSLQNAVALSREVNNSVSSLPKSTARLISDMFGSVDNNALEKLSLCAINQIATWHWLRLDPQPGVVPQSATVAERGPLQRVSAQYHARFPFKFQTGVLAYPVA